MNHHLRLSAAGLAAAFTVLAGCASTPETTPALDEARAAYDRAKADPEVLKHAAAGLDVATATLERAGAAESVEDMNSLAYVAKAEVQTAEAIAQQKGAEAKVEQLGKVKNSVQLEMRDAELAASQRKLADLEAKQTSRGTVVTLSSVLFATGKSQLLPGAMPSLDRLAAYLKENSGKQVIIEGHTDSTGSDTTNLLLSQERADTVRMALLSRSIEASRVTATGLGSSQPVASNDTAAGRQQNRRVEIIIT